MSTRLIQSIAALATVSGSLRTASALAAPPQTVTITFAAYPGADGQPGTADDVPVNARSTFEEQHTQIVDQFASAGIRFGAPSQEDVNEILYSSYDPGTGTGPRGYQLCCAYRPSGYAISAAFIQPVDKLSMRFGGFSSYLNVRGESPTDNITVPFAGDEFAVVTVDAPFAITSFTVSDNPDVGRGLFIDDLTFTVVPEPATLGAFAASFLSLTVRRRIST